MPMLSHGLQKLFMVSVRNKAWAVFGSGGEGEKFFSFTGGADRFVMAEGFADEVSGRFLGFEAVCALFSARNENSLVQDGIRCQESG